MSDACHIDGILDAPGVPPDVVETGREHGARCDQREGGCTGGRGPPVGDRDGVFQPLSWSVGPRAALVVMDCRRRSTPGYIWGTRSAARKRLWKQPNGTVARLRGAAVRLPALGSMPAQRWSTGASPARLHRKNVGNVTHVYHILTARAVHAIAKANDAFAL